jgi:hypothetical protein
MAKQTGYIKAIGTVDDNINFYKTELDGFLVRLLPGVDSTRYWSDPAFEGSRRSAERFGVGNITSSPLPSSTALYRLKEDTGICLNR